MPTCLACGNTDSEHWAIASDEEYFSTSDPFTYYHCKDCGVLFIDPVPKDRLQQIYPENYYSFDEELTGSLIFRIKDWLDQRFFKKHISTLPQEKIQVLDVGGGNGLQLNTLRKVDSRIDRTVVVDLDEKAGDTARKLGHEYFCGTFEHYQSNELFDVILMLNIIEHVDNPKELLEKAQSLLSPQGIVIIKTPNTDSLDARIFRHNNWGGYHCPRHWVLFNRNNIESLVHKAGLKVANFQYTQGAVFWSTSILYFLGRHKWIRVSGNRPVPKHPLYPLLTVGFACWDILRGSISKTSQMLLVLNRD